MCFPGSRSRQSSSRAAGACSGSARRTGWRRSSCPEHGVEFEGVSFGGIRGKGWKTLLVRPSRAARRGMAEPRDHPAARTECRAGARRLRVVPRRAGGGRAGEAAGAPRRERDRRPREPRARVRRRSHPARIPQRDGRAPRGQGRVGRQSAARRDHPLAGSRGAIRWDARDRCGCSSSAEASAPRRSTGSFRLRSR